MGDTILHSSGKVDDSSDLIISSFFQKRTSCADFYLAVVKLDIYACLF